MSKPKYKDSMFRDYFNDKVRLLSLCNALLGTNFNNPDELEINTLDGVFFSQIKNDLSCLIQNRLIIIIEHQSTINENMPLRMLFYITELLRRRFKGKHRKLYNEQLIHLPKPEFFVIYNGNAPEEDYRELKLSTAFEGEDSMLELQVKVYNVNAGRNEKLLNRCKFLNNYCVFINRVRYNLGTGMSIKEAIVKAVRYCESQDVMKEYLESKEGELIDMIDFEFDINEAKEVWREEAMAKGMAQGIEKGMTQGIEKGMTQGIEKGIAQGIEKGMAQGIEKGIAIGEARGEVIGEAKGKAESLRNIMQTLNLTVQQAMDALKIPQEEREKYASMI